MTLNELKIAIAPILRNNLDHKNSPNKHNCILRLTNRINNILMVLKNIVFSVFLAAHLLNHTPIKD